MNIVILNECFLSNQQLEELGKNNTLVNYEITANAEQAIERIKDAEVIFVDQFVCPLGNDILDNAKNLKLIILNTTSYHLLDLEYLKSKNISVCNTPDFCSDSVAELVFSYVLSLMRNAMPAYNDNKEKPFEIYPDDLSHRKYVGNNLNQKTIGVIGLGNIGTKVCSIAKGFNMNILGYNRSNKDILGVKNVGLSELLQESDIIIITVPYTSDTDSMINHKNIDTLKNEVKIINISSHEIIDESALLKGLKEGKIGGYGLDNFTNKDKNHFLYNSEKVMILPHLGFFTQESLDMIGVRMMEGYYGYIQENEVNRIV